MSSLSLLLLLRLSCDLERTGCLRSILSRSLCLRGDLLLRLLGERDLRLRGEWFNLRLELIEGLSSLWAPAISRDRILSLESLWRSSSLRLLSTDRDLPLLGGDLLWHVDLSCLDALSVF